MKFETEIIAMASSLVNGGDENVVGCTTSGVIYCFVYMKKNLKYLYILQGTESIILAIKSHRDYYRSKYGLDAPEMIACTSAHAAVDKACEVLRFVQTYLFVYLVFLFL